MKDKKFITNIGLSIIAQGISLLVSFVMNLILPKFISEIQYAYWQTYLLYVGYVGILHFGILDGIILRYSKFDYEELDKKTIRSQFIVMTIIESVFCAILVLIAVSFFDNESKWVFAFVAIGILMRNTFNYTAYLFQMTNRIKHYAKMIILYRLFYGIVTSVLLAFGVCDFYFYCILDLCSDLFAILTMMRHNKGLYFGSIPALSDVRLETKRNIKAGIMLMGANWSAFLLTGAARVIVQLHWDQMQFGKISFSFSIANLFLTFVSAISVVVFPTLKRVEENGLSDIYVMLRNKMSPLLLCILLCYYPGCAVLRIWIPAYNDSLLYLGILLPMIVYSSKVSLLTNNYFKVLREEKKLLGINVVSVCLAIVLFTTSAFVFDNLMLLVMCIVIVLMTQSIVSEIFIMKYLKIYIGFKMFFNEIIMTGVFILSATCFSPNVGLLVYLFAVIIFLATKKAKKLCERKR